jgi:subtilisin family serine protease
MAKRTWIATALVLVGATSTIGSVGPARVATAGVPEGETPAQVVAPTYVVAYDRLPLASQRGERGTRTDRIERDMAGAGGELVDVNAALGIALVRSEDDDFIAAAGEVEGVEGVVRNSAIGTDAPDHGEPHRYAEERPPLGPRSADKPPPEHWVDGVAASAAASVTRSHAGAVSVAVGEVTAEPEVDASAASGGGSAGPAGLAGPAGSSGPAAAATTVVPLQPGAPKPQAQPPTPSTTAPPLPAAAEPLADRQWDMTMIGATAAGAHTRATGRGVDIGIIDTGIDATHPDIAPNFDPVRSRNFVTDIPEIDGPCETPSCVDPAGADDRGHGTHLAGVAAGARNGFGMAGVAPEARLVNLRAGQDGGYFFLFETLSALTAAGDLGLDVVNMSFYVDPWLFYCDSADDYVRGRVSQAALNEQILTRTLVTKALEYAHDKGVTLVGATGNEHTDLAAPERYDPFSPSPQAPGTGGVPGRVVTPDCIDLPSEGPDVITVGSVGPSMTKADYSNYGLGHIDVTAPGGWARDLRGTPAYQTRSNLVLSAFPQQAAISRGMASADGEATDAYSMRWCKQPGQCGFYTYLQGSSMAAPHVVGVAALIIQRYGVGNALTGYSLAPDMVTRLLEATATDRDCPAGGVQSYEAEGRPPSWNAACQGTTANNSLYGHGIVDARRAVSLR